MLTKQTIEQVITSQRERLSKAGSTLPRPVHGFANLTSHAFIVTGVRRCGKSTLLQQINNTLEQESIYINFEDPRLAGFELTDFNRLQEIAEKNSISAFFFDEIQTIDKWESFIRFRLDEGYRIFISGSNATMLSKELGTKLTGRHISKELFPFSYREFLQFTKQPESETSSESYITGGGLPEYLKTNQPEVLMQLFNDIIIRDITLRYNIKNITTLQQLAVWLVSNPGKLFTGNSLRKLFQIGSSSSIMEYLNFFNDAYLFFYVPRFSFSGKVQLVNPKKIYCIDNGFIQHNSVSFSPDNGRFLENMVFLHLRRKTKEICYFAEKNECDFVTFQQKKPEGIYQVCWQLNHDNLNRELNGLKEAMDYFGATQGTIVTFNQNETFEIGNKTCNAIPFYEWAKTI
ncbi:ATP-binding protein [Mariniphaga sp.]|uniref:ATP-binding protein n=1 Tax=Mariniphaga sp. TaxID=1954475 RepID=UPI003562FABC